jgi:hypothetical protein
MKATTDRRKHAAWRGNAPELTEAARSANIHQQSARPRSRPMVERFVQMLAT